MPNPTSTTTPTRHCIKYVKWERLVSWRERVRDEGATLKKAYPYSFASRDPAFLNLAGNVLWLVTLPRYGGYRQAPSLVARLHIDRAFANDDEPEHFANLPPEVRVSGGYVVEATHDPDAYLPMNNVFHTLLQLRFDGRAPRLAESYARRDRSQEDRLGPYTTLAGHFQRHRWVHAESVPTLEAYAAAVQNGRRVFLSYKRTDFPKRSGRRWIDDLAEELSAREISCWWDRWNLPQADEDAEALDEGLLEDLLDDAVRQAAWFVALIGPDYLLAKDDSWPRKEWMTAAAELDASRRRHRMHRLAVFFTDRSLQAATHQRWVGPGDAAAWVGPDPDPAIVAEAIENHLA